MAKFLILIIHLTNKLYKSSVKIPSEKTIIVCDNKYSKNTHYNYIIATLFDII